MSALVYSDIFTEKNTVAAKILGIPKKHISSMVLKMRKNEASSSTMAPIILYGWVFSLGFH